MSAGDGLATVVCIVGATASGKSALAENVAMALGSSVISADAMQVYRGMDIGTAKVPPARRRCALEMVDVADVDEEFSVACYQTMARRCVDATLARGRIPVLAGGTGLYLDSVIDEMDFPQGSVGSERRAEYERVASEQGAHALHEELRRRDPESASLIHENNVRRVIRALELADEGVSYAAKNRGIHKHRPHYLARIWGIDLPREQLYERIDARVDEMIARGLVDEVRALCDRGLGDAITAKQAIGYKEIIAYLDGLCTLGEAVDLMKRDTRRYAKRQLSWLRRDGRVRWLDGSAADLVAATRTILDDLGDDVPAIPSEGTDDGTL